MSIVAALNEQTTFGYDPNGNLLTVTDARGNSITHEYDSMDRLNRRIDQLGKAETFSYDGNGNLVIATDRKNQTTTFSYDPLNRRTQASYADGAVASFQYDAAARLLQADDTADPHRPISMAYDALDRLLAETTSLGTVSYQYDGIGRRTQMTVSGQSPVAYTYDAASRLRTITQAPLNPVDIQYDASGRRTLLTLPNGVSTEYQYDLGSRLTALIYRNALGLLGDLTYQYDAAGNRHGVGGSFARTLLPEPIPTATYDAANQQLAFGGKSMTFDANGNLTTITEPSGTTTFTWDARNRLVTLIGPGVAATFTYGGRGRRSRTINGRLVEAVHDGPNTATEIVDGIRVPYLTTLGIDEPLLRQGQEMYLKDNLGSIIALTDANGSLTSQYTYEAFGRSAVDGAASTNPFQYTGRENDGTGLYYYRARYYHPILHRFLSEDRINRRGAVNLYTYARNNPLRWIDPFGLWSFASEYGTTGEYLSPHMSGIENTVDRAFNETTNRDGIVTYTTNGAHSADSLHYSGDASDLRTRDMSQSQISNAVAKLRQELGPDYEVINEGSHIHIEYDPNHNGSGSGWNWGEGAGADTGGGDEGRSRRGGIGTRK